MLRNVTQPQAIKAVVLLHCYYDKKNLLCIQCEGTKRFDSAVGFFFFLKECLVIMIQAVRMDARQ